MSSPENDGVFFSKQAPVFSISLENTSTFFEGCAELRRNEVFTDFTLTCCGEEFKVHRLLLYAHSLHFRQVFVDELDKGSHAESYEVDTDPEVLGLVLQYLYEGRLNDVLLSKAEKLAKLAYELGIAELSTKCRKIHLANLTPLVSNCLQAWSAAVAIQDQDLMKKSL